MNLTNFSKKLYKALTILIPFYLLISCGSYQYVGMYEDGIYGYSENEVYNSSNESENSVKEQGNSYYNDYFKGKVNEYTDSNDGVFTEVDNYNSSYDSDNNSESNNAGWGENIDSNIVINIQTRPNYGMYWGWNNWGWNNWGWNNWGLNNWGWNNWGWNNWGYPNYGYWYPYQFSLWNNPFLVGYGYYPNSRAQNIAYTNGYRNNSIASNFGNRTSSLSSRSVLGTVSKARSNSIRKSKNSTRSYNTKRPSTSTKNIRYTKVNDDENTRKSRWNSSTRKTMNSNRSINSSRSNNSRTTSRTTYPSSRSSSSMSSPKRSSGSSSKSRGGGSTMRRKN